MLQRVRYGVFGMALAIGGCMTSEPTSEPAADEQASEQAQATDPSAGPFATQQALVAFWTGTSTGGAATQIFLNGHKVFDRTGFGPPLIAEYFACQAGGIYEVCPTDFIDGFSVFKTLVSRIPAGHAIVKDGVLFRAGTDGQTVDVTTCFGDQSLAGTVKYVKVTEVAGFSPPYESTCYP